jgi:acyl carrier protein
MSQPQPPVPAPGTTHDAILACLTEALESVGIDVGAWPDGLTSEVSLDGDLGVDSFQLMQVARHLEKAYGYAFSLADWVLTEEESENPTYTVGRLIAFVSSHVGGAPIS